MLVASNQGFLEGPPGARLLQTPEDVVEIIGACLENGTRSVLLYAENLTDHFFDLSSGEAGAILQKLRNYHIRVAIVAGEDSPRQSRMFREMAAEESRGNYFRIFEDRDSAEAWLVSYSAK
jgi:hypothetical protein